MSISRKEIVDYICAMLGTGNVVLLDEFETDKARHICRGGKDIVIMSREYMDVALPDGNYITAEYYLCRSCGKLLLNKNSLTLVGGSIPRSTYVSPVNSGVFGGMVEGSM